MVESGSSKAPNAISGALFCLAIYFFISGWSAIEVADDSEDLARGTVLENDEFSNQLNENMRNSGYEDILIGLVLFAIGLIFSPISSKQSNSEDQTPVKQFDVCELCGEDITIQASIRRCVQCKYYLDTTGRKQPMPESYWAIGNSTNGKKKAKKERIKKKKKRPIRSEITLGKEEKKKFFCPQCETQLMVGKGHFGEIKCPECKEQFNFTEIEDFWWNE